MRRQPQDRAEVAGLDYGLGEAEGGMAPEVDPTLEAPASPPETRLERRRKVRHNFQIFD